MEAAKEEIIPRINILGELKIKFPRPRISRTAEQSLSVLPDGDRLLDNYDLCRMLNISKRTLQRYRTFGDLPYQMIYHKTFYRELDVLRFIELNFSKIRKLKKERANNSFGKRE